MPVQRLIDALTAGGIATVGGIAYYMYKISNGEQFDKNKFFIHAFLAFFIGMVTGEFIPDEATYKYGMVTVAGFFAIEIIKIAEKKMPEVIGKIIDKWPQK